MISRLRDKIGGFVMVTGFRMMTPLARRGVSTMVYPGWKWADENPDEFLEVLRQSADEK